MRINPAIAFTLILLSLMVGAGFISATWGYGIGREALTGVRQPDSRPFNDYASQDGDVSQRHNLVILKEEDILEDAKARIEGGLQ